MEGARGNCILVIDDERPILDLARHVLESAGYEFIGASSGRDGLSELRVREEEISAVVLDITMPDMSGEEVLKSILERDPDIPVLVISGYDMSRSSSLVDSSLVRFLKKPFRPSELVDAVAEAIG